jgi:hypothetical protein
MQYAHKADGVEIKASRDLPSGGEYYCPRCKDRVDHKPGKVRSPYFSHRRGFACPPKPAAAPPVEAPVEGGLVDVPPRRHLGPFRRLLIRARDAIARWAERDAESAA